ncbi:MAG: SHOCT domain-containing protein [Pontibacterium sp.]
MLELTPAGQQLVADLAYRYALQTDTVEHMLIAVNNGGGTMAQFNVWELGGSGQWMQGGMTMVGDMFNMQLKNTVDNLCNELSNALATTQIFPVYRGNNNSPQHWWPSELDLGAPHSTGSQNSAEYAIFNGRLAVKVFDEVTVYNTLDHHIGGVGQQQGGNDQMTFTSQYGVVPVATLPVVYSNKTSMAPVAEPMGVASETPPLYPTTTFDEPAPIEPETSLYPAQPAVELAPAPEPVAVPPAPVAQSVNVESSMEALALIEKLGQLHAAGVLSESEFQSKKAELLSRL